MYKINVQVEESLRSVNSIFGTLINEYDRSGDMYQQCCLIRTSLNWIKCFCTKG